MSRCEPLRIVKPSSEISFAISKEITSTPNRAGMHLSVKRGQNEISRIFKCRSTSHLRFLSLNWEHCYRYRYFRFGNFFNLRSLLKSIDDLERSSDSRFENFEIDPNIFLLKQGIPTSDRIFKV